MQQKSEQICQPTKCVYTRHPTSNFMENVNDVANALAQVLIICGLHKCKAQTAVDEIKQALLYYDEIRGIDGLCRKSLRKEDFMHELGRKCLMTRLEALLTYTIVKRAFKAFYYGTCECCSCSPVLDSQLLHLHESLWVNAAKRIAQNFVSYKGWFYTAQKSYEQKILEVFNSLFHRLKQRGASTVLAGHRCESYSGKMAKTYLKILSEVKSSKSLPSLFGEEEETNLTKTRSVESFVRKLVTCEICKCPKSICGCKVESGATDGSVWTSGNPLPDLAHHGDKGESTFFDKSMSTTNLSSTTSINELDYLGNKFTYCACEPSFEAARKTDKHARYTENRDVRSNIRPAKFERVPSYICLSVPHASSSSRTLGLTSKKQTPSMSAISLLFKRAQKHAKNKLTDDPLEQKHPQDSEYDANKSKASKRRNPDIPLVPNKLLRSYKCEKFPSFISNSILSETSPNK